MTNEGRLPAPLDPPRAALRAALLAHQCAGEAEERDRAAMLALVESEPACFVRTTFAPGHFTGSAFIFSADSGHVLLHHHRRLDRWLQMGGHDEGESDPALTALREGREESGLSALVLSPRRSSTSTSTRSRPAGASRPTPTSSSATPP
jgi:8-oxo-dGTP pyrophosphatase MutT (NUDIX family)